MASLTGPRYVARPNAPVSRSTFYKVSTGPLDLPDHAGSGGLQYQISWCEGFPLCYEVLCQTNGERGTKTFPGSPTTVEALPFVVYSTITCSPVGMDAEQLQTYLADQLEVGEQATVERVFSEQLCGQFPGLANNEATADLTAATDIVNAVSMLENWLYETQEYGPRGVLHVPLVFAAYFSNLHLLDNRDSNGVYRTALGTAINFGNYAGTDPTGGNPAAGSSYIYITGQTAVWRAPSVFSPTRGEMLKRTTNVVTSLMEREIIVSFDCHAAGTETPISGVVE
jgi:hypothetical protein